MNTRYNIFQKFLALVLTLVLVIGLLPKFTLPATAVGTDAQTEASKVSDPSTINGWKEFFGPEKLSTEFAGGVWTDKSVFTDAASYVAAVGSNGISLTDSKNFLVALSAIAANKEVTGLSSTPTDTMLVLDLSNSMDGENSVPDMITAANSAIDALLSQNKYNRVGVVLYSGNTDTNYAAQTSSATVILPLGRYTGVTVEGKPSYLSCSVTITQQQQGGGPGNKDEEIVTIYDSTVSLTSGVTYENGTAVTASSKQTNGGTYIQNGLYKAWQEFEDVTDTKVNDPGSVMDGVQRTPILVLMSDGAPTIATESYYNVGTSNTGNGGSTTDAITFLTQLTASYVKGKVETKYGTDAKFYTLGLGTSNSQDATSVLYPTSTNDTISGWWTKFLAGTAGQDVEIIASYTIERPGPDETVPAWELYRDGAVTEKNYVDRYWYASNSADMITAFQSIVDEIELQSAYSATLVESGDRDLDGYISFEDEIGELMEVKEIKGIKLGSTLFTGAELAKSMNAGTLGSVTTPSEYGNEFVATVRERIGIDTSTAQALIGHAYTAGQLSYTSDTQYSNYIGWYANAAGEYLGFWQESDGYTMDNAPEGAVYINKSYGYLGANGDSDMMHVVVMLRTEIATSHQDVVFDIPASLIPMVTYKVTVEGASLETAVKLEREDADPISLVYEVGLRSDINSVNLEAKIAEYLEAYPNGHIHENVDGTYSFYTNSWGHGDGEQNPVYDQDLIPYVAESHFHPSLENERYYYIEDTDIYVSDGNGGYILYTGDTAPSGSGYFHRRTVVTATENGGTASVDYVFAPISSITLSNSDNIQWSTDHWEVKAGVAYTETTRFDKEKAQNSTATLEYSNYPMVVHDDAGYNVYYVLGNNGKLTVEPAQGIKVSKTLSETSTKENAPDEFEFVVTLKPAVAETALNLTDADGKAWTGTYDVEVGADQTVITLTLADGEEVYIIGLPEDTAYTVEETQTIYYNSDKADDTVTGTVTANHIDVVNFVNSPRKASELTITKTVIHPFAEDPAALDNIAFTVLVDLGIHAANLTFQLADGSQLTADANGVLTVTLKDEQSVTITGLLEDTPFTATEVSLPDGFVLDAAASTNLGTEVNLTAGSNVVHVVNNYKADPPITPSITVTGTKTVEGNYTGTETFTFVLERYMGVSQEYPTGYKTVGTGTAVAGGAYTIVMNESYDAVGTYNYRITETSGSTTGMTYDASRGLFSVVVTDDNMDGKLEYVVTNYANTVISADYSTVTKDFTNTYSTTSTYVDIAIDKVLNNDTGVEILLDNFHFGLYETGAAEPLYQATTDATGKATIRIPLDKADTYTYILKEIPGDMAGMSYDTTEYTVTITVTDVNSQLVAVVTTDKDTANADNTIAATFTNTYDLKDTTAVLTGDKDFVRGYNDSAIELTGGEFSFQLWTANADFTVNTLLDTVTNGADGAFSFKDLAALSYSKVGPNYYIIREVPGTDSTITYDSRDIYVLVNVTAEGDALKADVYYRPEGAAQATSLAQFTNTYNVTGTASVTIDGSKTLTVLQGERSLAGGEFTFRLEGPNDYSQTVSNHANGSFAFSPITYTPADIGKTFTYTVTEVGGSLGGMAYDSTVYTVKVEVKDKGDGTMEAVKTVTGGNGTIVFENKYTATSVATSFTGTKTLEGRTMTPGEFTFELYATDADFSYRGDLVDSDTNADDRSFTVYTETYTKTGYYYYILAEKIPEDRKGVAYDASEYHLTVQVVDNGSGQLVALKSIYKPGTQQSGGPITFGNTYTTQPAKLELTGTKQYDKILFGNEFTFELKDETGATLQTKRNDEHGSIDFDIIYLDEVKEYTFTVTEDATNPLPYIDYDERVYTVKVDVRDDGEGNLYIHSTTITADDDAKNDVTFVNDYQIIYEASVTIEGTKYYLGADLDDDMFSFQLLAEDGKTVLQTVENTASTADTGAFKFETITYKPTDAGKTFTYYVREVIPEGAVQQPDGDWLKDGIFYDPAVFTVTVTLTDNDEGGMTVTKKVNGVENDSIAFTNSYSIVEGGDVTLTGIKELHGIKDLEADMFTFWLHESNEQFSVLGDRIRTATNKADGTFSFEPLTFTKDDIGYHYYLVREIIPADAVKQADGTYLKDGITYDIINYKVTIKVEDDNNGGLLETVTITGGGTPNTMVFNNFYNVADAEVTVSGTKTYEKGLNSGDFTFGLYENGHKLDETTNNDGSFTFDKKLTFTAADIGKTFTYTVQEIAGALDYIDYDDSVFTITVKVEDNGDGTLKLTKTITNSDNKTVDSIGFTNTYVNNGTGSVALGGDKTYINSLTQEEMTVAPNLFTFELRDEQGELLQSVKNLAGGAFEFEAIPYTAADIGKTYIYTVSEVKGDKTYISYDDAKFTVEVKISDDNEGGLTITTTIKDRDNKTVDSIGFTNTYVNNGTGSVTVDGTKTYTDGRTQTALEIPEKLFSFNLSGHGINETVTNAAGGSFSFTDLEYTADDIGQTYTYTVSEVKGDKTYISYDGAKFTVEVKIDDNGEGGLTITKTVKDGDGKPVDSIGFTNTYVNNGTGSVTIDGQKKYNKTLDGGEFTFILSQILETGTEKLEEVKNEQGGSFSFKALEYTADDIGSTYTYTVQEFIPTDAVKQADGTYLKDGITYDPDVYNITVTVEDNGEGGLKLIKKLGTEEVTDIKAEFNNSYDITGTGKLELTGTKELTGGKPMADGDFSFGLFDKDGKLVGQPVANQGNEFTITVEYGKDDISDDPIVYTVKEIVPEGAAKNEDGTYTLNGITYDATVYTVKVTVSDNGKGGIDVDYELVDAEAITFQNVYTPADIIVDMNVLKNVVNKTEGGITAEGFKFELHYGDVILATYTSDADGKVTFPVAFSAEDIGNRFTFQIKEVNTGITGVTYDTTVHTVTVAVSQNQDGTLKTTVNDVQTDEITVAFTNTYEKPGTPVTGDTFDLTLIVTAMALSAVGLAVLILYKKKEITN